VASRSYREHLCARSASFTSTPSTGKVCLAVLSRGDPSPMASRSFGVQQNSLMYITIILPSGVCRSGLHNSGVRTPPLADTITPCVVQRRASLHAPASAVLIANADVLPLCTNDSFGVSLALSLTMRAKENV
jgi:hypothetical protein